ncbi:MAG: hypothetical protein AMJ93_01030 [Anaerolineae bacterium SM23_84]|nr:MAG: hypothetical protein AMJ93_01030 [Anaerolineae bacterium SM23_84]
MSDDDVSVDCYSGHAYAQEPRSFVIDKDRRKVKAVHRRWREPAGPRFEVLADDNATYVLAYDEAADRWHVSCQKKPHTDAPNRSESSKLGEDGQR